MKKLLLLALLLFTGFMGNAQLRFINLSPTQFNTALEEEAGEKLIDVRQDWEFAKGHLKAAENVDFMGDDFGKPWIPFRALHLFTCIVSLEGAVPKPPRS